MARREDLAEDLGREVPALVVLRSSGEGSAVVCEPAAKSAQPGAKRLDLAERFRELQAVPAKARNPERPRWRSHAGPIRPAVAHRPPGTSRSAQRMGYSQGADRRGRFRIRAVCSSSCTTKRSTRR